MFHLAGRARGAGRAAAAAGRRRLEGARNVARKLWDDNSRAQSPTNLGMCLNEHVFIIKKHVSLCENYS